MQHPTLIILVRSVMIMIMIMIMGSSTAFGWTVLPLSSSILSLRQGKRQLQSYDYDNCCHHHQHLHLHHRPGNFGRVMTYRMTRDDNSLWNDMDLMCLLNMAQLCVPYLVNDDEHEHNDGDDYDDDDEIQNSIEKEGNCCDTSNGSGYYYDCGCHTDSCNWEDRQALIHRLTEQEALVHQRLVHIQSLVTRLQASTNYPLKDSDVQSWIQSMESSTIHSCSMVWTNTTTYDGNLSFQ